MKEETSSAFGSHAPKGQAKLLIHMSRSSLLGRGLVRKFFLRRLLSLPQDVYDLEVRGVKMRLHVKTNSVESKLALKPEAYCPEEFGFMKRMFSGGEMDFVDIGANIGAFSLPVAAAMGVRTLAIEPNPAAYQRLRENAQFNPGCNLAIDVRALRSERGVATFYSFDDDLKLSGIDVSRPGGRPFEVETIPLLDLLDEHGFTRPYGMKIDVEGHEDEILKPFFESVAHERWPKFMIIEAIPRQGLADVIGWMKEHGYQEAFHNRANMGLLRS